jgi:hypothetical protein
MDCPAGAGDISYYQQRIPARSACGPDRDWAGAAGRGSGQARGGVLPFKPPRHHTTAIIIPLNPMPQRVGRGDHKKVRPRRLVVFKLPAYDPVAIAVMGFGIVFAAALALAF